MAGACELFAGLRDCRGIRELSIAYNRIGHEDEDDADADHDSNATAVLLVIRCAML